LSLTFFIIMVCVSALALSVEFRSLIKEKAWLSLALSIGFVLFGLIITFLIQIQVKTPSLAGLLLAIVKKLLPFVPAFFGG